MANHRNIIRSEAEYKRSYENMLGVCSSNTSDTATKKFLYTENMYVDHEAGDGAVESIPGFRVLHSFPGRINGIFIQKPYDGVEYILVHSGTELYRFDGASYDSPGELTPIAELADVRSHAFVYGRRLCIIDGVKMLLVDSDGAVTEITETNTSGCYVPLTYRDGVPCEQPNLLSPRFKEETSIASSNEVTFGSPELIYSVTDAIAMTCSVVGVGKREAGPLYIPAKAVIGGRSYTVTEIAPSALRDNTTITELITSIGLERIGKYALWGDTNLVSVSLSPSVAVIDKYAFRGCSSLEYMLLGIGTVSLGENMLTGCDALTEICYTGDAESFAAISGTEVLGNRATVYTTEQRAVTVAVKVHTPVDGMTRVTVDTENVPFTFIRASSEIVLSFDDRNDIDGKLVTVYGNAADYDVGALLFGEGADSCTPERAILGCRVCEVFDGRIFLSGNPTLGGAVFYSSLDSDGKPHPLYFGSGSCFVDGASNRTVSSLLTDDGALAVFKSDDDGSGSIFYHTPSGKGADRSYPVSYIHSKVPTLGEAYRFLDGAVFMSPVGLSTLKRSSSDYKELRCLSGDISSLLCREDYSTVSITEWQGYLVLLAGGNMYLGDATSRLEGEGGGYDWYYVSGVGTYANSKTVYRYSFDAPEGFDKAEKPGEVVTGSIGVMMGGNGTLIYYAVSEGKKYLIHPTDEKRGGTFSPASIAKGNGRLLFFGTETGELCVFNNDKRGVPPEKIKASEGYNEADYLRDMGDRIHPTFYSFAGIAPRYAVVTASDGCGYGYLEKRTVPSSLVLKLKNFDTGRLYCDVNTDIGTSSFGLTPTSSLAFCSIDFNFFSSITRGQSLITVADRSQGWTEKQIALYTEEFASPFGVYSIFYRYKIKGKIKKTTT